jgi:hypothetical protein
MTTKENLNNLITSLSEVTKTLNDCVVLAAEELKNIEKLQGEVADLQKEKSHLAEYLHKAEESLNLKRQKILLEIEEEQSKLFSKLSTLKQSMSDDMILNDKKPEIKEKKTEIPSDLKQEPHSTTKSAEKKSIADTPPTTLVDQFKSKASINDKIVVHDTTASMLPVHDISKAIGINDRFLFLKELFDNDKELYTQAIKKLNTLSNIEEAKAYIKVTLKNWDKDSEPAQLFLSIVHRRYI